jgi:hypothetical protein
MPSTRRKACGVMRVQYIKLGLANDRQRRHRRHRGTESGNKGILRLLFPLWF